MKIVTAIISFLLISTTVGCAIKPQKAATSPQKPTPFPQNNLSEITEKSRQSDSLARAAASRMDIVNGALLTTRQEIADLREKQETVSPARLEELESHLVLLTEAFKDLYAIVAGLRVLPQIKYAPVKSAPPKGFKLSDAGDLILGDEQSLFQRAMEYYRTGRIGESRQLFIAQLESFPQGALAGRAAFWIGETYFYEKEYNQAISAYVSAEKHTGSTKADDALYKQAVSYVKLGENDRARELFNTLIGRYPASEYVNYCRKQVEMLSL